MLISPPFSAEDYLRAVEEAFMLPENAPQVRGKTRASALASCAREQMYMMGDWEKSNAHEDDLGKYDIVLAAEEGRHYEDLSIDVIRQLGYGVVDRQISLPPDYPVSGHPDGRLVKLDGSPMPGGLTWGFEHKHFGRWGYQGIYKRGIIEGAPEIVLQTSLYGDALGWDCVLILIIAKDASSNKTDAKRNLQVKDRSRLWVREDWNPKAQVFALDLRPYKEMLVPRAHLRAKWFEKNAGMDPAEVWPEYDPVPNPKGEVMFPCSYCEWRDRCAETGLVGNAAPALPFKLK